MKSILLIGLGNFGKHIALQLNQLGHQVMAVDHNDLRNLLKVDWWPRWRVS